MMYKKEFFLGVLSICISFYLSASEEQILQRRLSSHLVIEDSKSAVQEARQYLLLHPEAKQIWRSYIRSLAAQKQENLALQAWKDFTQSFPEEKTEDLLEEVGWTILRKGITSSQYSLRLASIIGAYITKDAKAIPILLQGLHDTHALIRSISVQVCCEFLDHPLKEKLVDLFAQEKNWLVRLELIKAMGKIGAKEKTDVLTNILDDPRSSYEEKQAAISGLIMMYEQCSIADIQKLAKNPRAALRILACNIALHFQMQKSKDLIMPLLQDARSDVRISAIRALGYLYMNELSESQIMEYIQPILQDSDPTVSISAAWIAMMIEPSSAIATLQKWLKEKNSKYQLYAAAALASSGDKAIPYMIKIMQTHENIFVKANIALGLIRHNKQVSLCCDTLYEFLQTSKQLWMITENEEIPFQVLEPSRIRHVDQIPNYPEAVDQMCRLSILSILAIQEDTRAHTAIASFLLEKKWGITGFAAATLLKEGDENSLDIIRDLLKNPHPKICLQAALVLALYGKDESAIPYLEKSYDEVDPMMKLYILEALGHIANERVVTFLTKVLEEPFLMRKIVAASALLQSLLRP